MAYFTLMASLPRHKQNFKVKETPLSRIQLEKRLKLLSDPDHKVLSLLENVLWNSWFTPQQTLQETKQKAKQLYEIQNSFINELMQWLFDLFSVFVAFNLRRLQNTPPTEPKNFWISRWTDRIIHHWQEPNFGLENIYPWLAELNKEITHQQTAVIENNLLHQLWQHLKKIENQHYFDFEAVIIYLLRWNIVNYWSQFNEELAMQRMNDLIHKLLLAFSKG